MLPGNDGFIPNGGDPYWDYVTCLLHCDGDTVRFKDSSKNNLLFLPAGDAKTQSAAGSPVGGSGSWGGAGFFDGSDYIFNDGPHWQLPGDFTIEFWFYQTARTGTANYGMVDFRIVTTNTAPHFFFNSSSLNVSFDSTNSTAKWTQATSLNTWYHVALVRIGTSISFYLNGSQVGSSITSSTVFPGQNCTLGSYSDVRNTTSNNHFTGYIEEFRVTKGIGRYAGNFSTQTEPFPDYPVSPAGNFYDVMDTIGITSSLVGCFDAGDKNSAITSTSQNWYDLCDNQFGQSFIRGSSTSATTDDPTFNGTVGNLSINEYYSFDGGDSFLYSNANAAQFYDQWHKAGATYTLGVWLYAPATNGNVLLNTQSTTSGTGIRLWLNATGVVEIRVNNGATSNFAFDTTATVNRSAWNFYAISVTSAGAAGTFSFLNGTIKTPSAAYANTLATGDASNTLRFGTTNTTSDRLTSGARVAGIFMWDAAISQSDITAFYNATKSRFGL